ncbi:tape measure protein [Azotobacter chroococcum]|uniref:Tape measure domain-containing protein n=1 Tax=Azotobacter chroococcum TaxID=353 RepID=A0A4R1PVF5_9GAMM|nr:tape measure protein [Azotobacter chroococcum]TBV98568.1 tape measure domain-containing protein [Azotobacter chroococcum]TCL34807.1 tape measure domain-containing protein [Azotobacter chroococcum]
MAGIKDRLIQFVLRGRDELSPAAEQGADALEALRREGERLGTALDKAREARGLAASLAAAGRAAEQARGSLVRAEQRADDLRKALDKDPESEGLVVALREAEREAARATRELNRATTQLGDLEQAAKAAGIDTDRLADEQQRLAQAVGDSRQALDQHTQQLRELERQEAAAARGAAEHASRLAAVREALDGATRQVLAFAGAFVGIDAAIGLVNRGIGLLRTGIADMLKTGDQMEGLELRINSLMGSMESGEKAIAWIKDFTKTAPMTIAEVTDAFALLKGFGLDPMDGSLQALVDKNAQLGGEMDRLQGIVIALGQAWGKEKLQAEEITQLVERGIPAWQLLSQATGKTVAQLQELSSEGRLGRDVIAALIAELGKSAEGQALSAMSRLSGQLSQLKNAAQDFYDRIAQAGALDYVKGKFDELLTTIREMDSDGRLDKLAKSLSTAFIDGARRVEEFGRKLLGTDFKKLSDDSAKWLNDFGTKLDQTTTSVQLFVAPFRTLFNGITSGFSVAALAATSFGDLLLSHLGRVANFVPDMLGGDKLRAGIAEARGALNGLTEGFAAQIEQDGKDIRAAWDVTTRHAAESAAAQTAAVKSKIDQQRMLDQAYADELIANQKKTKDAAVAAAAEGTAAIGGMAEALKLIDAGSTTVQIDGLRDALREAYQSGAISQQDYARASGVLNEKLRQLQRGAGATAGEFAGLEDKFASLESIMGQIARAANEVDFSQIRTGLRKAYSDGAISAEDFAKAQAALAERMNEVKKAAASTGRSFEKASADMADASAETEGSLRQIGGAAEDAGAGLDFFGSILSQAREPLAGMTDAALKAFDALQGINNVDWGIDTGSLDATRESLRGANEQLAFLKTELAKPLPHTNAGIWAMETLIRSHELQVSYLGQKKALQSLMEGYEDGSISLESFIRRAERAQRGLSLLDSSDLSSLKSALAAAEQQMRALGDSSRNTLDGLQSELAQLRGDQEEVDRRAFANRRRELEAQRAEAQSAGNGQAVSDLNRAIATLQEIEAETANRRLREQQQAQAQAQQQAAEPAPATTEAQPATVIRLESPRGRRVDVQVPVGQQTQLLDILADAGLRTL